MTTNPLFNNFTSKIEQDLLNSLTVEAIQQKGQDVMYVPREIVNYDELFGTDDSSRYNNAYTVEMYILTIDGFSGDRDFFSQFGNQIMDEVKFSVSIDRFMKEVGTPYGIPRPNEGDLIYFPLNKKCFQVKFVEARETFYQLGKLYTYELTCELFEYSGEEVNTGEEEIDKLSESSLNVVDWAVTDGAGSLVSDDDGNLVVADEYSMEEANPGSENDYLQAEAERFVRSRTNPFGGDT